jgi:TPP-dependent pyruvate/acetoin dehydrogenase alpha subunit/pyruvate/2-oxoglutarate/acetoin dehydrogenase E1 component
VTAIDPTTADGRREALRTMLLVREFEDRVAEHYADGEIPGFVHLSQGQEAVAVGACAALGPDDYVTSTHRAHGHSIAKGLSPEGLMAELYGKAPGYCGGKSGSMHVASPEEGMLGAQPIVGASVPLGVGAALTAQTRDEDWVAVPFLGDGATAAGQVHEGINLAATWDLPAVFVVENNRYSEGMTFDEQHNVEDIVETAAAYGIPGRQVDGQDVLAVYETVSEARERARAGEGPTLVEAETYRYRGHFEGDDQPYRTEAEVEEWRQNRDPIDTFRAFLIEEGDLTPVQFESLEAEVATAVDAAVDGARDADCPDTGAAYEAVFDEPVPETGQFRDGTGRWDLGDGPAETTALQSTAETRQSTIREAIGTAIHEEMAADERVLVMGQDEEIGGSFDVTAGLYETFGPDRVRNTPISEAAQVGAGVGAAATGLRPVINLSFADFIGVCFDQVMNQAGKTRYMFDGVCDVPLTLRAVEGGGINAAAQHSGTLHTLAAHLPGIKVVAPGTPAAAKGLTKASIRSEDPVIVFESKVCYDREGPVPEGDATLPLGEAAVEREGSDVTVVATQRLLGDALSVADDLAPGVDVEVIDPRTLYPLDTATIAESTRRTGRLVVADESPLSYGFHAEVLARVTDAADPEATERVGVPDTPVPFAPGLEDEVLPGAPEIRTAIDRVRR